MEKIIIYGGKGWIGNMFLKELVKNKVYAIHLSNIRLENYKELETEIEKLNPDSVICCIGRTGNKEIPTIDYLENPKLLPLNLQDNLQGPLNLAILSEKYGFHMTYIGTGCIYTYDHPDISNEKKMIGFHENDLPNFFGSQYSSVKGKTDLLLRNFKNVLNCRIRLPIISDYHEKNLITKLVKYTKICSKDNSITVLDDIIPVICHMIKTKETGIYNMTNPGYINHDEILEMYKNIVNKQYTYNNFTEEEMNDINLSKRSNCILSTMKIQNYCESNYIKIPSIKDSVKNCLEKYKITEFSLLNI